MKRILKEIDADSGSITVKGNDVTKMSKRQVPKLRRNIGIVFQDFRLLPKKTVYENVAFAMEIVHQPRKLIKKYVPQVLSVVGISDKSDKYPDELSAGEQQRVAIARAIVNKPRISSQINLQAIWIRIQHGRSCCCWIRSTSAERRS